MKKFLFLLIVVAFATFLLGSATFHWAEFVESTVPRLDLFVLICCELTGLIALLASVLMVEKHSRRNK